MQEYRQIEEQRLRCLHVIVSLCVRASEMASRLIPACLASVAPVCLSLYGVACVKYG